MATTEVQSFPDLKVRLLDPKTMQGGEMQALWQKVATQDYAFDDASRGDPRNFVLSLVEPNSVHFTANDAGYVLVRNVYPESDASIHFVCWDRNFPFRSIIEAGRQVLDYLYTERSVNRVTGYIPKYNALALRFATTMGFKFEGTLRKQIKFKGEFHDVDIYGLLAKEFVRRYQ